MSYYRDVYLKSEDWKSLRKLAIVKSNFRCQICGLRPTECTPESFAPNLDVHHLDYKNLHDVRKNDLRTVCRKCHNEVHELLEKYPGMKKLPPARQWATVLYHLRPERRQLLSGMVIDSTEVKAEAKLLVKFAKVRDCLVRRKMVFREKLKWKPELAESQEILDSLEIQNADIFLMFYKRITGIDPTRPIGYVPVAERNKNTTRQNPDHLP